MDITSSTGDNSTDPLDFFNSLSSARDAQQAPDPKAFPGKTAPKNRGPRKAINSWLDHLPFSEYSVGGVIKRFYTVGALASALERKPVTIRSWEQKGWLPPASFRTPAPRKEQIPGRPLKGRRLYSEAQVVFLVEAAVTYNLASPDPDWDGFRTHIQNHYPKN